MTPTELVAYFYLMMETQPTSESLCFSTKMNHWNCPTWVISITHLRDKPLDSPSFKNEQLSNFNNTPTYTTFNLPSWHHGHSWTGWLHCWFQSEYEPASPAAQNNSELSQNNGPVTFIFTSLQRTKLSLKLVLGMSGGKSGTGIGLSSRTSIFPSASVHTI
jgi:hypothetical protein